MPGGRLPENFSEIIILVNEDIINVTIGSEVEISGPRALFSTIPYNVTVVGIINFSDILAKEFVHNIFL